MDTRPAPSSLRRIELGPGAEFDRIRRVIAAARAADPRLVPVGPGDDCAVVDAGPIAISVDLSVEGVHFRREWLPAPRHIGARAVTVALSDLAASAAVPLAALVSIAMTADDAASIGDAVMDGVREAVEAAGGVLIGGDLTRSPGPLFLDVIVLGRVEVSPVLRSGARPGDAVWVTGLLGGAGSAVHDWLEGRTPSTEAVLAYVQPHARTEEARWLATHGGPTAMIDLSDGLAGDSGHLAAAGGVRIIVDEHTLPVHPAARSRGEESALAMALGGGEDYELCFTAPPGRIEPLREAFTEAFGLPLTRVGEVVEGSGVVLRDAEGRLRGMPVAGYDHFTQEGR